MARVRYTESKKYKRLVVAQAVMNDPVAMKKAFILLYENQTPREQSLHASVYVNDRGVRRHSAVALERFIRQLRTNSVTEMALMKKHIGHYVGQLVDLGFYAQVARSVA